uniref:UBX domain-containing protein n=2 Tax=Compsopogon caeruleus TaxID=31354 RepID=A0A7S1TCF3_9RHOD|mmetsp:Transcript_13936/g.28543  ORF Transcript_13936/g.28543 Transcript_13936/m.28543 type:complete len:568 (+) Transcript_13936:54-1757(+)
MGSVVVDLSEVGRSGVRVKVPVGAMTLMSSVRDEAVRSGGASGAVGSYGLRWKRGQLLDLSVPFRLTGVPQNGRLELVRVVTGSGKMSIAVHIEVDSDGGWAKEIPHRVVLDHDRASTISHVVRRVEDHLSVNLTRRFDRSNRWLEPQVSYMNRPVTDIQSTTLSDLGLAGSSVLRLRFQPSDRKPPPLLPDTNDQCNTPLDAPLEPCSHSDSVQVKEPTSGLPSSLVTMMEIEQGGLTEDVHLAPPPQTMRNGPSESSKESHDADRHVLDGVIKWDSSLSRGKSTAATDNTFAESRANGQNGGRKIDWNFKALTPEDKPGGVVIDWEKWSTPVVPSVESHAPDFAEKERAEASLASFRNVRVYSPPDPSDISAIQQQQNIDIPDEFYEFDEDDLKAEMAIRARKASQEVSSTLQTRKMREHDLARKAAQMRKVLIRIELPDRSTIEGTFSAEETLKDLYDFTTGLLAPKVRDHFFLFTSPPFRRLDPSGTSLFDSSLIPAAIVRLGLPDGAESTVLGEEALHMLQDRPRLESGGMIKTANNSVIPTEPKAELKDSKRKVPKWFKRK